MTFLVPLAVLLGAVPAGYLAAVAARRLGDSDHPKALVMIGASAVMGVWAALIMPAPFLLAVTCALGWTLLVLSAVDLAAFRLPDILTLPLIVSGIAIAWWLPEQNVAGHFAGALVALLLFYAVAAAYQRVRHQEGLGLGDVKLAGAAGAWLGWQALPYVVLLACALGLVWVGIATMRRGRAAAQERIPFGVALCFAIWVIWLYGSPELFGPMI